MPTEQETWQFARKTREGRKHRTEQSKNMGGEFKCMRCGKRSNKEIIPGGCLPWLQMDGQIIQHRTQK